MTNPRIIVEINLQDIGDSLKEGNKDAKALRGTLESIQKLANNPANKAKSAAFGGSNG